MAEKDVKEKKSVGLQLELDETPEAKKGKWFKVPGFGETYLLLTQMLRHEHKEIMRKATSKTLDNKSRQMVDVVNDDIADKEYDRAYINHIHGWKGVMAKRLNEKKEVVRVPLEFKHENVERIIDVWASHEIGQDADNKTLTFILWLRNTLLDAKNFVDDDTENLQNT